MALGHACDLSQSERWNTDRALHRAHTQNMAMDMERERIYTTSYGERRRDGRSIRAIQEAKQVPPPALSIRFAQWNLPSAGEAGG